MEAADHQGVAGDAVAKVRSLLYRRLKVTVPSGRVLLGDLQCLDKQGNLILSNTVEVLPSSTGGPLPTERTMGMVLVPKAQQEDVQIMVTLSEKAAMLSLAGAV